MPIVTERDAQERLRSLVQQCKTRLGIDRMPSYEGPNHPLAILLNIEIREQQGVLHGGNYIPGELPYITIDPYVSSPERLNFTFFHEVTHHLLRGDGELYGFLDDHASTKFGRVLEDYCNIGAAEFLIPYADVKAIFRSKGFSMGLLPELDASYPASRPAIAIQMAQCAQHQCVVIICEQKMLSQQDGTLIPGGFVADQNPSLVAIYSSSSPSFQYRSGINVRIPPDHIISSVYTQKTCLRGKAAIPVHSGRQWIVDCDAIYYVGKVYAAFNVTSPPSLDQPAFNFLD